MVAVICVCARVLVVVVCGGGALVLAWVVCGPAAAAATTQGIRGVHDIVCLETDPLTARRQKHPRPPPPERKRSSKLLRMDSLTSENTLPSHRFSFSRKTSQTEHSGGQRISSPRFSFKSFTSAGSPDRQQEDLETGGADWEPHTGSAF
mmetsp:Transcript_53270/g.121424  ORF Transcript_53270/g.121424 Transcript_53270/m.121424 type:complete len:149 (+) Transcript_53270:2064-2510(+)